MLDHAFWSPREDEGLVSSAPPPAGEEATRKKSPPNKGGPNMADFILTRGCCDSGSLQRYNFFLEEGAARRHEEDTTWGWQEKRLRGDTQSWCSERVDLAWKMLGGQRRATNKFLSASLTSVGAERNDFPCRPS